MQRFVVTTEGSVVSDGDAPDGPGESEGPERNDPSGDSASAEWKTILADAGRLTPEAVDRIAAVHGDRGLRAIDAVSERRVKRYRDFTVVVGHRDEYIVEDGVCTCKDAEYNLDQDDPDQRCWHALAVEIADRVDAVDHHDMWYSEVREFL